MCRNKSSFYCLDINLFLIDCACCKLCNIWLLLFENNYRSYWWWSSISTPPHPRQSTRRLLQVVVLVDGRGRILGWWLHFHFKSVSQCKLRHQVYVICNAYGYTFCRCQTFCKTDFYGTKLLNRVSGVQLVIAKEVNKNPSAPLLTVEGEEA